MKTTEGSITYLALGFNHNLSWHAVHSDGCTLFDGFRLIRLPGHTSGMLNTCVETPDGDVLVASGECYAEDNYTDEVLLDPGLLWNERG